MEEPYARRERTRRLQLEVKTPTASEAARVLILETALHAPYELRT